MIRLTKEAQNLHKLTTDKLEIWFSYEIPVAFGIIGGFCEYKMYITKNIWSSTTGKHLNMIDPDGSKRVENSEFNKLLEEALK